MVQDKHFGQLEHDNHNENRLAPSKVEALDAEAMVEMCTVKKK